MRVVGLLVTVATLAAVYFFVIKPVTDTTGDAFESIKPAFESVQDAQKQAAEAQKAANQAAQQSGSPAAKKQANDLQRCLVKAGQSQKKIANCLGG